MLRRGPRERVDRLVGVTDDGEIVTVAQPRVEHPLLQGRDVLVLVDDEAAVPVAELLRDDRVLLQRSRGVQQQVVEVEHLGPVLQLLVVRVDRGDLLRRARAVAAQPGHRRRVLGRGDQARLGPLDLGGQVAYRVLVGARLRPDRGLADGAQLVLDQLPLPVAHHPRPEVGQLPQRCRVKRARLHPARAQRPQPGAR